MDEITKELVLKALDVDENSLNKIYLSGNYNAWDTEEGLALIELVDELVCFIAEDDKMLNKLLRRIPDKEAQP